MLLALDTATRMTGLALHDGTRVLAEAVWQTGRRHTTTLAPETAIMLRRLDLEAAALTALAVAQGPGSYTGLRIGMAFAKGLAASLSIPLVAVPTFDILAYGQPKRSEPMLAIIEAGRGRVSGMWYKWGRRGWQSQGEAQNRTWAQWVDSLEGKTYLCGEIDAQAAALLAGDERVTQAPPALCVRRPSSLAELAWPIIRAGKFSELGALHPIYLPAREEATP